MRRTYGIRIHRNGMADLMELCECQELCAALDVLKAILNANDPTIVHVTISVKLASVELTAIMSPDLPAV